ncbi:hypothetical protein ES703_08219 [subsurface metagenome]
MGLTIHWDLELKGTDGDAFGKLQELKTLAERLPLGKIEGPAELDFTAFQKAYKAGKRYGGWKHWASIQGGFADGKRIVKAFCLHLWPGEGCEAMNIGLRRVDNSENWDWASFCKTQYAEEFVKCHLLVIRILDECKRLGILKEVHDEGHYWETRDLSKLGQNINASTMMLATLFGQLEGTFGKENIEAPITKKATHITKLEVDAVEKLHKPLPPDSKN